MTEENRKPIRYMSVCSGIEAASIAWDYLGWEPFAFAEIEPLPCAVLASRWPHVLNLGDLTKISVKPNGDIHYGDETLGTAHVIPNDGQPIDVLIGGTPCFAAGTMVLTTKGYVPIETIQVGDKVVSHDGSVNPVLAIGSKLAENVGKLKILGRPEIDCTPNHPFYSIQMRRNCRRHEPTYSQLIPNGEYEYTAAESLAGRHVGRLPIDLNGKCPLPEFPFAYGLSNEEIMELAGWYVGDGYIRSFKGKRKKTMVLALVAEKKINLFTSHFPRRFYSICKDGKLLISCTALCNWLSENFGEHADKKRIPYWVYCTDLKKQFLEGYEASDGCRKESVVSASSVSKSLAYGYADLGQNASVAFCKMKPQRMLEGRVINQKDCWLVRRYLVKTPRTQIIGDRYATICRKWEDGTVGLVFNLTVATTHSYIVEGIAVHNCQSFSIAGSQEGLRGVSGIALEYVRLVYELAAYKGLRWFVHENVPNMLSCGKPKGSDYATLLSAFTGWDVDTPRNGWGNAGIIPPASDGNFGVAYRVLDVQYTRVDGFSKAIPQRRRRVFTCGCIGSWQRAAEILFEQRGLLGNQPPKRKKKQTVARTSGASPCRNDGIHAPDGSVAEAEDKGGTGADQSDDACGRRDTDGTGDGGITVFHGSQDPIHNDGACANALGRNQGQETCVCCGFQQNQVGEVREYETAPTLNTNSNASGRNAPLACVEEPAMGDGASIEGEKEAFNFEMFSGECKGVSPALQAQRAKDTLVYGDEQIIESKKGGYEAANTYTACQYKGVNNQMPIAVEVYYP